MKLKFVDASALYKNLKATIHKSGKLGFTIDAARKLNLPDNKSVGIAFNEEDSSDDCIYIVVNATADPNSFKINKAGEYFYLNTKSLFDGMDLDYTNESIAFDILPMKNEGSEYFRLKRRKRKKVIRGSEST